MGVDKTPITGGLMGVLTKYQNLRAAQNLVECLKTGLKRFLVVSCFAGCAVAVYKNREVIEGHVLKVLQNVKH